MKHERFHGKCVLMSHQHDGTEVQGTGFYGLRDGCVEMKTSIPDCYRLTSKNSNPVSGTSLVIAGFMEPRDWRRRVASSVMENFFYAIDRGQLKVLIEPGDDDGELFEIDDGTLGNCFTALMDERTSPEKWTIQTGIWLTDASIITLVITTILKAVDIQSLQSATDISFSAPILSAALLRPIVHVRRTRFRATIRSVDPRQTCWLSDSCKTRGPGLYKPLLKSDLEFRSFFLQ